MIHMVMPRLQGIVGAGISVVEDTYKLHYGGLLSRVEGFDLIWRKGEDLDEHCLVSISLGALALWSSGRPANAACTEGGKAGAAG